MVASPDARDGSLTIRIHRSLDHAPFLEGNCAPDPREQTGLEHGERTDGCGEWPGVVERLTAPVLPHMGWSTVDVAEGSALFKGVEHERFYFVHSYGVREWILRTNDRTRAPLVVTIHDVAWRREGTGFTANGIQFFSWRCGSGPGRMRAAAICAPSRVNNTVLQTPSGSSSPGSTSSSTSATQTTCR